jgi:hypothetical protein
MPGPATLQEHLDPGTPVGAAWKLIEQSIAQIATTERHLTDWLSGARRITEVADAAAIWGVLPVALALLVLYEMSRSAAEGRAFGVAGVVIKTMCVVGALLGYDRIVALITAVAGAGGAWPSWDSSVAWADKAAELVLEQWDGLDEIPRFFTFLAMFMVLTMASLVSYGATLLLSLSQGAITTVLLAVGKLCIAASLAPGVHVAKSWAKMLAMVAAWSTVGGTVAHLLAVDQSVVLEYLASGNTGGMLRVAARLLVLGAVLIATPWLTAALFSGVAAMAPGFGAGVSLVRSSLGVGVGASGGMVRAARGGAALGRAGLDRVGRLGHRHGLWSYDGRFGVTPPRAVSLAANPGRAGAGRGTVPGGPMAETRMPFLDRLARASARGNEPGLAAFRTHGTDEEKRQYGAYLEGLRSAEVEGVPEANAAMKQCAQEHGAVLRTQYAKAAQQGKLGDGGGAFNPEHLTPVERTVLDELSRHKRFGGWAEGVQGAGDFHGALSNARIRWGAEKAGRARKARAYAPAPSAWSEEMRKRPDVPAAASAPHPVPVRAESRVEVQPSGSASSPVVPQTGAVREERPRPGRTDRPKVVREESELPRARDMALETHRADLSRSSEEGES